MSGDDLKIRIGAELKEIKSGLQNLRKEISSTGKHISSEFDKSNQASGRLANSIGSIRSRLAGLVSGAALIGLTRSFVKLTDDAKSLEAQIRLVTDSEEELKQTQSDLYELAEQTRSSLRDTTALYARLARSSKEYGATQEQLLVVTKAINQATRISGGDSQASQAAITQLTQALASGVLRGQELNSVLEQAPRLAEAIAKGMKIPFSELRKEAEKGKITTDEIINALIDRSEVLAKEFEKLPKRTDEAIQGVNNALIGIFSEGDTSALTDALDSLKETLEDPAVKQGILDIAGALIRMAGAAAEATSVITREVTAGAKDIAAAIHGDGEGLSGRLNQLERYLERLEKLRGTSALSRSLVGIEEDARKLLGFDFFEYLTDEEIEEGIKKIKAEINRLLESEGLIEPDNLILIDELERELFKARTKLSDIQIDVFRGDATEDDLKIAKAMVESLEKRLKTLKAITEEKKESAKVDKLEPKKKPELTADANLLKVDEIQRKIAKLEEQILSTTDEVNENYKKRYELQRELLSAQVDSKKEALGTAQTDQQRVKILTDIKILERDIQALKENEAKVTQEAVVAGLQSRFNETLEELRRAEESINNQQELGEISALDAEAQIVELRKQHLETLKQLRGELGKIAEASTDPRLTKIFEEMGLKIDSAKAKSEDFSQQMRTLAEDSLANAFSDILTGVASVEDAFKNMLKSIADAILKIAAQKAAAAVVGSFHTGGVVGAPRRGTHVIPPMIFDFAPRYHSGGVAGLKPNEVPAVLEKGEEVLTANDPRHRNNLGKGNTSAFKIVNVVDPSLVDDHLMSERGEEIILNVLRRNGVDV